MKQSMQSNKKGKISNLNSPAKRNIPQPILVDLGNIVQDPKTPQNNTHNTQNIFPLSNDPKSNRQSLITPRPLQSNNNPES